MLRLEMISRRTEIRRRNTYLVVKTWSQRMAAYREAHDANIQVAALRQVRLMFQWITYSRGRQIQ